MRIRHLAVAGVAALAAFPSAALAQEGTTDKATGGGQVLFSDDDVKRSTIAFTAQNTGDGTSAAKGQVQFIDRSAGGGQNAVKFHGTVTCIVVEGNRAQIAGLRRGGDRETEGDTFELTVVDNGEPNRGNDMIMFDNMDVDGQCEESEQDSDEPEIALAKGNAQVRDGDAENSFEDSSPLAPLAGLSL